MHKVKLKNQICHHSHIIFQPHNFESDKKIIYEYQYVDDISKKYKNFSDYCIFRFIPQRIVKVLSELWICYGIQVDFINTMLVLDMFLKKLTYDKYDKLNSSAFKLLGMTDYSDFINIINVLISTQIIDVINLRVTNKMLSFKAKLKNDYTDLKYNELFNILDTNIHNSVQQIIQLNNETSSTNKQLVSSEQEFIWFKDDPFKESSKDNISNDNFSSENNINEDDTCNNFKNIDTKDEDSNNLSKKNINEKEMDNNMNTNQQQINNDLQALQEQNRKLILDNSELLSNISKLRRFHGKDIDQMKTDISNQMSILVNNVIKELTELTNNNIAINNQKNIIKVILNCETKINDILN